jgi:hypothetical protein
LALTHDGYRRMLVIAFERSFWQENAGKNILQR